jgi:hypothetical protein
VSTVVCNINLRICKAAELLYLRENENNLYTDDSPIYRLNNYPLIPMFDDVYFVMFVLCLNVVFI